MHKCSRPLKTLSQALDNISLIKENNPKMVLTLTIHITVDDTNQPW